MTERRYRSLSLLAALAFALAAGPALAEPAQVGVPAALSLGSHHPYAQGSGPRAESWIVYHPGATYIRVHFSKFDLAPGDWLEISDPAGSEIHAYEGKGPHGTGEFWAFSILGDTAVLRLQANIGGGQGFEIDTFGRGIEPIAPEEPSAPLSVCGTQDWKDVKCYETSNPTEYARARGSVLALIGCCSACTAFKVSDSGQFMTNNHCTSSTSGVQSTELRFDYQTSGCASGGSGYTGSVMGSQMLRTDATLDYTLFTTTGDASSIPCLELDNRLPAVGERIYIAGHPSAGVKKLSIESDMNAGGLCAVDAAPYPGNAANTDVAYYCDTTNGSSGSPVLSGDTNKVVSLHHFGGCLNSGARMDLIVPQISSQLGSCAGGGSSPVCGNNVLETGEVCDGTALGGQTCQTQGYAGGTLACSSDCQSYNTSGCTNSCKPLNTSCSANSQCCSNRCGKLSSKGRKVCLPAL